MSDERSTDQQPLTRRRRQRRIAWSAAGLGLVAVFAIATPWALAELRAPDEDTSTASPEESEPPASTATASAAVPVYGAMPDGMCEQLDLDPFHQLVGERLPDEDLYLNDPGYAAAGAGFECDFFYGGAEPFGAHLNVSARLDTDTDWESEVRTWMRDCAITDVGSMISPSIYGDAPPSEYPEPEREELEAEGWDIAALVNFPEIAADMNGHDPDGTGTAFILRTADEELQMRFVVRRADVDGKGSPGVEAYASALIEVADQVREAVLEAG